MGALKTGDREKVVSMRVSRLVRAAPRLSTRPSIIATALVLVLLLSLAVPAGGGEGSNASTPRRGGTVELLGTSDIFNLDTVSAYSTINILIGRTFARQLLTYRPDARFAEAIKLVPDIAIAVPTSGNGISADGRTYTFRLRRGVMWDSSPPRQVTADDFVRELKCRSDSRVPLGDVAQSGNRSRGERTTHSAPHSARR